MFLRKRSVAGNARILNIFSFWFCLRFFVVTAVLYFAHVTGSYVEAVSMLVICRVAQGLFEIPTGILSDRIGRVWCLRIGAMAAVVSVACYLVGGSYWWLAVGSVFDGLWEALFSGNNEALLYESARESGEDFGHLVGQMNVAMEVAGFVAMIAGGFLAAFGYWPGMVLTMIAQSMALVASFWLVEPARHVVPHSLGVWGHFREAVGYMRRNETLRNLSLSKILGAGVDTFALWPAFYATLMPVWAAGMMVSVNYLESAIGFRLAGRILKRWGARAVLLWSTIIARVLMYPALVFPSVFTPLLMALGGAPYGPFAVAESTLMQREFTDHQRATMASITAVAGNVLYAGFALLIGLVADTYGAGRAILFGQIFLLPTVLLYWRIAKHK